MTLLSLALDLTLTIRDLEPEDLTDLDWAGGAEHLQALAEAWQHTTTGDVALLLLVLPNGRLMACGAVDFHPVPGVGLISKLSVHETLQGLGLGSALVRALETRSREQGCSRSQLHVEQDNPRAAALYRRLGYREVGSTLECWPIAGGQTYVTVSTVLERELRPLAH